MQRGETHPPRLSSPDLAPRAEHHLSKRRISAHIVSRAEQLAVGYPQGEVPAPADRLPLEGIMHSERYSDYSDADIDRTPLVEAADIGAYSKQGRAVGCGGLPQMQLGKTRDSLRRQGRPCGRAARQRGERADDTQTYTERRQIEKTVHSSFSTGLPSIDATCQFPLRNSMLWRRRGGCTLALLSRRQWLYCYF